MLFSLLPILASTAILGGILLRGPPDPQPDPLLQTDSLSAPRAPPDETHAISKKVQECWTLEHNGQYLDSLGRCGDVETFQSWYRCRWDGRPYTIVLDVDLEQVSIAHVAVAVRKILDRLAPWKEEHHPLLLLSVDTE